LRYTEAMSMHAASNPRPPLLRALARPRAIALGCVAVLAACGWIYLGLLLAGENSQGLLRVLCAPLIGASRAPGAAALTLAMWCAMVLAMMLPTAAPMVVTYADLAETAAGKGEPAASPLLLAAGYITVWLGAAGVLAALQVTLARAGVLDSRVGVDNPFVAGAMFVAAGLYQFSALKHACVSQCQHPFRFFFGHWTAEPGGVFRIGLQQGLYCLGCCWAMMLLMFAVGIMNVVWMAILGIVMTIEKLGTTARFSRAAGIVFIALGLFIIIETSITGWPRPG
jgi:predicted metal-binding membrane protein